MLIKHGPRIIYPINMEIGCLHFETEVLEFPEDVWDVILESGINHFVLLRKSVPYI